MAENTEKIIYNLDACALITLESFYPQDLFPKVWEKLDKLLKDGKAYLVEEVFREIEKRDDAVHKWLKPRKAYAVRIQSQEAWLKAQGILTNHQGLVDINATQTSADPFVIADSVCNDSVVVTREDRAPSNAKRPKIPNITDIYKVRCICGQYYATEFFRENGWTFS